MLFLIGLVASLFVVAGPAQAQEDADNAEVIVRGSLEDAGDGTGAFVIEVESVERLASAIEVVLNYGPGIEMVLDAASQPACQIGSPWAGSCGPFEPDGQAMVAAFAFNPARELGTEVLVRLPVLLSGNADDQSWNLSLGGVWDFDGRPVHVVVAGGASAAAFLNVTPDCVREILVVTSDLPVVEASLVDVDGIATELALVEVAPGIYEAVPAYWDFAYVSVASDRDGVVVETDQYVGGVACDLDRDGVPDPVDNCPGSFNPSQDDFDDNGIGDSCDGTVVTCGNGLFRVATSHAPTLESLISASVASECWAAGGGGPDFELSLALFGVDPQPTIDLTPLTALKNLEIIDSGLTSLPTGLTSLEGLVGLGLAGNALSELPPEIGELENLTTLLLTDNEFLDVPLEAWTKQGLRRLSLAGNHITALPSGVSDELQQLYLMENQLTGDLTSFLDAWYSVDRDHGDDALLRIDDGPGGNDCVKTTNPEASVVWGLRRIALECDAEVVVEGRVWTPDGVTGVFGAQVCAERPLLDRLCVFTDVFGDYRFDNVGQGNISFTMTDPARRYEAPPTGFIGLVLSEGAATIDFQTFFVGLDGVDPGPEPTPTPGPEPTPTPGPEPTPVPPEPTPAPPSGAAMPGTISGRFFDDLGAPMSGGQVCVEVALVGTETCTTADGTGRFFFGGLFSGNYVVAAYANGEVVDTYQYASVSPTQGVTGIVVRDN